MKGALRLGLLAFLAASLITLVLKEARRSQSPAAQVMAAPQGAPPPEAAGAGTEAPQPTPKDAAAGDEARPGPVESRQPAPAASPSAAPRAEGHDKIVVYYFYTTIRCPTCRRIEALAEEALRAGFAQALSRGVLEWHAVNVQLPQHRHYVYDYQLYAKSLIVARFRAGRQVEWKNLARIWELVWDGPAFLKYVQREVGDYLRSL